MLSHVGASIQDKQNSLEEVFLGYIRIIGEQEEAEEYVSKHGLCFISCPSFPGRETETLMLKIKYFFPEVVFGHAIYDSNKSV